MSYVIRNIALRDRTRETTRETSRERAREKARGKARRSERERTPHAAARAAALAELPRSRGVQPVEVAGTILQGMLSLGRDVALKALERQTGIASAKLHRYMVSLARSGLVRRNAERRTYDFGLLAYRIGQAAAQEDELIHIVGGAVQALGEQFGETVGVARWIDDGATFVRWFNADQEVSISLRPGIRLDVTRSAAGKLFAAHLPRERSEPLARAELAEAGLAGAAATTRLAATYREYAAIRRQGLARALGTRVKGIHSISVPVFDRDGTVLVALAVLGHAGHFDSSPQGVVANALRELAQGLTRQLGGAPAEAATEAKTPQRGAARETSDSIHKRRHR